MNPEIQPAPLEVIHDRLLAALDDTEKVAVVLDADDLDDCIHGLRLLKSRSRPGRAYARADRLLTGLSELREQAFGGKTG